MSNRRLENIFSKTDILKTSNRCLYTVDAFQMKTSCSMLSGSLDLEVKYYLNIFNVIHAYENKVSIWVLIL